MPYYKICQSCGAHLDPGEQCDCGKVLADTSLYDTEKIKSA